MLGEDRRSMIVNDLFLIQTIFYSFKFTYIHCIMLYGTGFDKKLKAYINHFLNDLFYAYISFLQRTSVCIQ